MHHLYMNLICADIIFVISRFMMDKIGNVKVCRYKYTVMVPESYVCHFIFLKSRYQRKTDFETVC